MKRNELLIDLEAKVYDSIGPLGFDSEYILRNVTWPAWENLDFRAMWPDEKTSGFEWWRVRNG